jgi:hypothetical protein
MTDKKQKATPIPPRERDKFSPPLPHQERTDGEGEPEQAEYMAGTWAGYEHYQCALCGFDTLKGRGVMLKHLIDAHDSERALEELLKFEQGG